MITLDEPLPYEPAAPLRPARPDDGCYVLFTSGTTGSPDGVKVTHRNVAFDMAAWEILGCPTHGGTLVIRSRDLTATARRADILIATPTVLSGIDPAACPRVRTVAVAGEPCPRPLADRWARQAAFLEKRAPLHRPLASARATPGSFGPRNRGSGSNTASRAALPAAKSSRVPP